MKIYLIGQKGIPSIGGGVEKHVEMLAIHLVKRGHEVFAYTRPNYTNKRLKSFDGVNLISLPSVKTKHLEAISHTFLACLDLIRRKPDVIHFHSIGPSSLILLVRILKPFTPIIATFHCQDYYHKKWNPIARAYLRFGEFVACKFTDKTITVSKGLTRYAMSEYGVKTKYIPNGVEVIKKLPAKNIKLKWDLTKNSYILSVSRLIEHKGVHYLIDAYLKTKTSKSLVIAGDGAYTDDYVKCLKKMAKNNPKIIFTGNQIGTTLQELFSNAYLFVQPSTSEGLSIALLEAMASGNAVLVSDIPENLEVIKDTGFSFKNKSPKSLQEKINYLLKNPKLIDKQKEKAKHRVNIHYHWRDITTETIKIYNNLLNNSNPERAKRIRNFVTLGQKQTN
ncbi:MAG: glycosyltransferase family 4 protein [Candidatus Falkowbacteria bacterium]|nr:glycosyltransferase family 4 protein [Candidatus Falkowbacteria bacterium]